MKKISYILIVVGLVLVINSLAHSIFNLWSKQDLLNQAQVSLDQEKKENMNLKKQLSNVQSKAFIETEARDKLFMVKPGESNVIIPSNLLPSENQSQNQPSSENWQKWVKLFFPS